MATNQTTATDAMLSQWLDDLESSAQTLRTLVNLGPATEFGEDEDEHHDALMSAVLQVVTDGNGVEAAWVRYAREHGLTGHQIATALAISRATLYNRHGSD